MNDPTSLIEIKMKRNMQTSKSSISHNYRVTNQTVLDKSIQDSNGVKNSPPIIIRRKRKTCCSSCSCVFLLIIGLLFLMAAVYLFYPNRTNILILGLDYADSESPVARSDTIIVSTFVPLEPYVGLLSIPRDLWVVIPNIGENRINTAHFFAESQNPGSGPQATMDTIKLNMGITVPYYIRIKFVGFIDVVDTLGGLEIEIPEAMAGYLAGKHYLTGKKALAFARSREYADDFQRMQQAQLLIKALFKNILFPRNWARLPSVAKAAFESVDANIPIWLYPRIGLAVLRAGPSGFDSRVIDREMVTPFITEQGAAVLLPKWEMIYELVDEMFQ
jgi:polyisoprenyl-teichoic acid--peptidoglycan teichoic acid transferase